MTKKKEETKQDEKPEEKINEPVSESPEQIPQQTEENESEPIPEPINVSEPEQQIILTDEEKEAINELSTTIVKNQTDIQQLKFIIISIAVGSLVLMIVLYFILKPKK